MDLEMSHETYISYVLIGSSTHRGIYLLLLLFTENTGYPGCGSGWAVK